MLYVMLTFRNFCEKILFMIFGYYGHFYHITFGEVIVKRVPIKTNEKMQNNILWQNHRSAKCSSLGHSMTLSLLHSHACLLK